MVPAVSAAGISAIAENLVLAARAGPRAGCAAAMTDRLAVAPGCGRALVGGGAGDATHPRFTLGVARPSRWWRWSAPGGARRPRRVAAANAAGLVVGVVAGPAVDRAVVDGRWTAVGAAGGRTVGPWIDLATSARAAAASWP